MIGNTQWRAQCDPKTGSDRGPETGETGAREHEPPRNAGRIECRQAMLAKQARLLKHDQRQWLIVSPPEAPRADPGHRQPRQMFGAGGGLSAFVPGQCQIQLAATQRIEQCRAAVDARLHMNTWMRPRKPTKHVRQPGFGKIRLQAEAHLARERWLLERRNRFVIQLEQPTRVTEHDLTFVREGKAAPLLAQQRLAGRLLELA